MSYRIEQGESVEDAVARLSREQIDKALEAIAHEDIHEAVHETRKRCKKVRGALRLVRPGFAAYDDENAWYRDTARMLSEARDTQANIECLDALLERYGDALDSEQMTRVRDAFVARRDERANGLELGERLAEARKRLETARERTSSWTLDEGDLDCVRHGLAKTYRRARAELDKAIEDRGDDTTFHTLRKRVKYHRYQLKILDELWPRVLTARRTACHDLTDLLGDDHDLVELRPVLRDGGLELPGVVTDTLIGIADRRSTRLRERSIPLARLLFTEETDTFVERVAAYWTIWR